jgi:hypothetical protein
MAAYRVGLTVPMTGSHSTRRGCVGHGFSRACVATGRGQVPQPLHRCTPQSRCERSRCRFHHDVRGARRSKWVPSPGVRGMGLSEIRFKTPIKAGRCSSWLATVLRGSGSWVPSGPPRGGRGVPLQNRNASPSVWLLGGRLVLLGFPILACQMLPQQLPGQA